MARPNRHSLLIRLGIVAVGVLLGLALRWLAPPDTESLFDDTEAGTLRAREDVKELRAPSTAKQNPSQMNQ